MTETPDGTTTSRGRRSYHLVASVGGGGFGDVYRGELRGASGFVKRVAIKLLNEQASQVPELRARLRDEARLLALLRHRAIVHVEDLVSIKGRWAVVMEFVEGVDLKELIKLGPIPQRPVCEIAGEVASALQVAHEAVDPQTGRPLGIVHRDIKPGNIRLTSKGEVKVLDFGVARAAWDDREAETRSLAFGSPGYMAPERFDGLDLPAADIYALGAVIFEALSGTRLGQFSVNPTNHDRVLEKRLNGLNELLGGPFGQQVTGFIRRMMAYDHRLRPTAAQVSERFEGLFMLADGVWLKRWIPDAIDALEGAEQLDPPPARSTCHQSGPRPADPGLVLSGGMLREPATADSIELSSMLEPSQDLDVPPGPVPVTEDPTWFVPQETASPAEPGPAGTPEMSGAHASVHPPPPRLPVSEPDATPAPPLPPPPIAPPTAPPASLAPDEETRGGSRLSGWLPFAFLGVMAVLTIVVAGAIAAAAAFSWFQLRSGDAVDTTSIVGAPVENAGDQGVVDGETARDDGEDELEGEAGGDSSQQLGQVQEEQTHTDHEGQSGGSGTSPDTARTGTRVEQARAASSTGSSGTGSSTTKAQPPQPTSGKVVVLGEVTSVELVAGGRRFPPGELPPGSYDLVVVFPGDVRIELPGRVQVTAGETTKLRCDRYAQNCR